MFVCPTVSKLRLSSFLSYFYFLKKELTYDSDDEMKNEVNSDEEEMEENENGNFRGIVFLTQG